MVSALLHEIQRDAKHLSCAKAAKGGKEGASKGSAAAATSSAADAALREAMEARSLDGLMDAIHANADGASPALLDEARALRDDLKEQESRTRIHREERLPEGGETADACEGLACEGQPAFGEAGFPEHGEPGVTDCWMACNQTEGPCAFCGRPGEWAGSCCQLAALGNERGGQSCAGKGCLGFACCVQDWGEEPPEAAPTEGVMMEDPNYHEAAAEHTSAPDAKGTKGSAAAKGSTAAKAGEKADAKGWKEGTQPLPSVYYINLDADKVMPSPSPSPSPNPSPSSSPNPGPNPNP